MKRVGLSKQLMKDLKTSRKERLMSQKDLAEIAGMSRYAVILMEQGKHIPRGDKFVKILKLLKLEHHI
jgi:transcriptional regulator with XRE-family HTH domain